MLHTPHDYYFKALSHFDALEETTKRTITERDEGLSKTEWADRINRARRTVVVEAMCVRREPTSTIQETVNAVDGFIRINTPKSGLSRIPLYIVIIEDIAGGWAVPITGVPAYEQWQHQGSIRGVGFGAQYVTHPMGDRIRVLPTPAATRNFRFTYTPEPIPYTEEDLEDRTHTDEDVPPQFQDAVPVRAAKLAQMKESGQLDQLWADELDELKKLVRLRHGNQPKMIRYTRHLT